MPTGTALTKLTKYTQRDKVLHMEAKQGQACNIAVQENSRVFNIEWWNSVGHLVGFGGKGER